MWSRGLVVLWSCDVNVSHGVLVLSRHFVLWSCGIEMSHGVEISHGAISRCGLMVFSLGVVSRSHLWCLAYYKNSNIHVFLVN